MNDLSLLETPRMPTLHERWLDLRKMYPTLRIRDAAAQLEVSEAELVATGCGETVIRLIPEFASLLAELQALGSLLAITRNDTVVLEHHGIYENPRLRGDGALALLFRPGIDARLFLHRWRHAYAVDENRRFSLQFFDAFGTAAHKVYATEATEMANWHALVQRYRHQDQSPGESVLRRPIGESKPATSVTDTQQLREQWRAIQDVHEAQALIQNHGGDRRAIYAHLGPEYARKTRPEIVEQLLDRGSAEAFELMLFVMNDGAVQSYAGPVHQLLRTGPWFNVLDPGFNLHLRTPALAEAWWIRKPSTDGWVTTLDVFDHHGREVMLLADNREQGAPESPQWTARLDTMAARFTWPGE
ncbi:MAG: hemin-degrading factor [Thiotrichales bacterium]